MRKKCLRVLYTKEMHVLLCYCDFIFGAKYLLFLKMYGAYLDDTIYGEFLNNKLWSIYVYKSLFGANKTYNIYGAIIYYVGEH